MPVEKEKAIHLVLLSIISTLSIVGIIIIIVFFFSENINNFSEDKLEGVLWFIPLYIFLSGFYNAFQYWATRQKAFKIIAKTRIFQALLGGFLQIFLAPFGLVLGQVVQFSVGFLSLFNKFIADSKNHLIKLSYAEIKNTALEYKKYPKYSTWEALTNQSGAQIPLLLIAIYSIDAEAGFMMLAIKLMSAPIGLIGKAVSQVYLSEAPKEHANGNLKQFTIKNSAMLFKLGAIPIILAAAVSPSVVPFIFGIGWERTGALMCWMAPWFLLQFVVSPVSMALNISEKQKVAMYLQLVGLIFRVGAVLVAINFFPNFLGETFAIANAVFYSLYLYVVIRSVE